MEGGSPRLTRDVLGKSILGNTSANLFQVCHGSSELTGGMVIGWCSSGMASFLDIVVWRRKVMGCTRWDGGPFDRIHHPEERRKGFLRVY